MHQPDPSAHRRGQQPQQFFEGEDFRPGSVGEKTLIPKTSRHRLGRQVLGIDGLDRAIAISENGEERNRRSAQAMLFSSRSPSPKTRVGLMKA